MKKAACLSIIILLLGCNKHKKLRTYVIKNYRAVYNLHTKKFDHMIDTEVIQSKNDTVAYKNGLRTYYISMLTDNEVRTKYPEVLDSTQGFPVLNNRGIDIKTNLSKRVKDSLDYLILYQLYKAK